MYKRPIFQKIIKRLQEKRRFIQVLAGPRQTGKTTLFNIISGFLPADSGQFIFKNENTLKLPAHQIVHKSIARTFQDFRLLRKVTVIEKRLNPATSVSHSLNRIL